MKSITSPPQHNMTSYCSTLLSLTNHATHLCKYNGMADLLKTPFSIRVYAETEENPSKLGSTWGPTLTVGAWLTCRNTLLLYAYFHAEFGRSRSNGTSVIKAMSLKNLTPRVKVIQGHRNRHGSIRHL